MLLFEFVDVHGSSFVKVLRQNPVNDQKVGLAFKEVLNMHLLEHGKIVRYGRLAFVPVGSTFISRPVSSGHTNSWRRQSPIFHSIPSIPLQLPTASVSSIRGCDKSRQTRSQSQGLQLASDLARLIVGTLVTKCGLDAAFKIRLITDRS
ncbi:hypothetical protein [Rhodoferax ferrireducens]|uniref:hypothetical protein n=1 Tax=Rhodoferax ferrireducens TaxID=192843 RepID=UPI00140FD03D|nr:hypothetical protein [Rhodoferax ferrireducens]WPC67866.1 hypothetical protein SBP18_04965 [Rhodoferax ferrireducens]